MEYKALVVEETHNGKFIRKVQSKTLGHVPEHHTLVKVEYSSLNYKDALSARGHKGITRNYPHTPGIDASGIVEVCKSGKHKKDEKVIVTGYDLGMNTNGGFGQYIIVPDEWIVPLPKGMSLLESMIIGTAGFTAAICVYELQRHDITPDKGKILVTGATGGVGSMAVGILSHLDYEVTASSGKAEQVKYLKQIGANEVIMREELSNDIKRPLLSGRWSGVVENVGGETLSYAIKSVKQHGVVCVLGNVSGDAFSSTVYPFLLRGITLAGIDSASRDMQLRLQLWNNLAGSWKFNTLNNIYRLIHLDELSDEIDVILKGGQVGRVVVKLW